MTFKGAWNRIGRHMRALTAGMLSDRRGNFAITAALSALPLLLAVGGGIDFANATRVRKAVQAAADGGALAAARHEGADVAARLSEANAFFHTSIGLDVAIGTTELNVVDDEFVFATEFAVEMPFLSLFHVPSLAMRVEAVAAQANLPTDIVLVLDSSGSMINGGRMIELKSAVKAFLAAFDDENEKIQAALVPFDTQVRVSSETLQPADTASPSNPYAGGADCSLIQDEQDRQACLKNMSSQAVYADCSKLISGGVTDEEVDALHCSRRDPGFKFNSTGAYYEENNRRDSYRYSAVTESGRHIIRRATGDGCAGYDSSSLSCIGFSGSGNEIVYNQAAPQPTGPSPVTSKDNATETSNNDLLLSAPDAWSGCLIDRTQPYDARPDAPTGGNVATLYPKAHCAVGSLQPIRPLNNDLAAVAAAVDMLKPSGNTNVTIGIQWGMEAFTPTMPLAGAQSDARTSKIMVVLTDGQNTQNRWSGRTDSAAIDARTSAACRNVRAMGVTLFTINLINGNETLLRNCATQEDYYFSVMRASDLDIVFRDIASKIMKVRLVK